MWASIIGCLNENNIQNLSSILEEVKTEDLPSKLVNGEIPLFVWNDITNEADTAVKDVKELNQKITENEQEQKQIEDQIKKLQENLDELKKQNIKIKENEKTKKLLSNLYPKMNMIKNTEKNLVEQFSAKISNKDWNIDLLTKESISVAFHLTEVGHLTEKIIQLNLDFGKFLKLFRKESFIFKDKLNLSLNDTLRLKYSLDLLYHKQIAGIHNDCGICESDKDDILNMAKEHSVYLSNDSLSQFQKFVHILYCTSLDLNLDQNSIDSVSIMNNIYDTKKLHKNFFSSTNYCADEWTKMILNSKFVETVIRKIYCAAQDEIEENIPKPVKNKRKRRSSDNPFKKGKRRKSTGL